MATTDTSIIKRYSAQQCRCRAMIEAGEIAKACQEMREWVFRHVSRASGEDGTLCTLDPFKLGVSSILSQLRVSRSGYWCAGYAALLVCAYEELGLKSAVLAFGLEGGFTHAVTVVEAAQGWRLEDAYTNASVHPYGNIHGHIREVVDPQANKPSAAELKPSRNRLQPFIFLEPEKQAPNVIFPHDHHQVGNGKRIGLLHVSEAQCFQHPMWPRTEPTLLAKSPMISAISALFRSPIWISSTKHGYSDNVTDHPIWKEITRI